MTTQPEPGHKIHRNVWVAIILLNFAGQLAWGVENQFFNTFVYDNILPNPQVISWMVAASALTATVTSILMGALSDRTRTRWGKRKPYLLLGYIAWGILTAAFPTAAFLQPVTLAVGMAILFDSVMTFFGSTASDAALNAYIADVSNTHNRGRVQGVVQIMTWAAILIVYGVSGLIIEAWGYYTFFYMIGALVLVLGIAGGLLVREPDASGAPPTQSYWQQIASTFDVQNLRQNRALFLIFFTMTVYTLAEQIFFPYLIIYLNNYPEIHLTVMQSSLLIFTAILVGGMIMAYPFGLLADRIGRKRLIVGAVLLKTGGLVLFSLAREMLPLALTGVMWLAGMSAWAIGMGAWTKDLYPEDKRGQFAGYYILFTVAFAMVPGPLLGGWLSNTFGIPVEGGSIPTPLIFQVAGLATLLALIPLYFIKEQPGKAV